MLENIIMTVICMIIYSGEEYVDMGTLSVEREEFLRKHRSVFRKTALPFLKQAKYGRLSKKKMMFKAFLNPEVLLSVLLVGKK